MIALVAHALRLARAGKVQWSAAELAPDLGGGASYEGRLAEDEEPLQILVLSFSIEDQGFEAGSLGYDGALTMRSGVLRLPRPDAETLHGLAAQQVAATGD